MTVRVVVTTLVVALLLLSVVELACIADEIAAPRVRSGIHVDAAPSEIPPTPDDIDPSATPVLTR